MSNITIFKERRITALCNQSIVYEVDSDEWSRLKSHNLSNEEALAKIIESDEYCVLESYADIDEVTMVHHETIEEE